MKNLICAAIVAGSMFAMAEEAAKKEAAVPAAPVAAEAAKPKRPQMTDEQRAALREKMMQRRAAMKAEMDKKAIEVIKKHGLDDEKAAALWKDLQETMRNGRRSQMRRPMPPAKPAAAQPAAAQPAK